MYSLCESLYLYTDHHEWASLITLSLHQGGVGFAASLFIKHYDLHAEKDEVRCREPEPNLDWDRLNVCCSFRRLTPLRSRKEKDKLRACPRFEDHGSPRMFYDFVHLYI